MSDLKDSRPAEVDESSALSHLEELLLREHQNGFVASLAGGLAHHFNNLLSGMLGLVSLAPNLDPQALSTLSAKLKIQIENATRLNAVVLNITRRAHLGEKAPSTDLVSHTRDAVWLIKTTAPPTVQFKADLPEGELWAEIAPVAYDRAVLALLVTAVAPAWLAGNGEVRLTLAREATSIVLQIWGDGLHDIVDDRSVGELLQQAVPLSPQHLTVALVRRLLEPTGLLDVAASDEARVRLVLPATPGI